VEFWRTIFVLLRRKSVVLPVLLFSLGMAATMYLVTPTKYVSTATIVLTTSVNGGILSQDPGRSPQQINPLRNFDGMKPAVSILVQIMNTPEVANQLRASADGDTTYTVTDGSGVPRLLGSNGPFMVIEGSSTSPAAAREIVVRAEQRLQDELINQQRVLRAPPSTFIGTIDVVAPTLPEAQQGGKLQAAVAALVLCAIAAIGLAYFRDRSRAPAVTGVQPPDTASASGDDAPTIPAASRSPWAAELNGAVRGQDILNADGGVSER
jgi:hypothetical protein